MTRPGERYWNAAYADPAFRVDHDGWLERYAALLRPDRGVIADLGCGLGHNARTLHAAGYDVLACDLSEQALERLRREEPGIGTMRLDMEDGLPFEDGALQAVVADLSLHYFTRDVTHRLVGDIRRTLRRDGLLLCRVNALGERDASRDRPSADDPYLYESEGIRRRFFDHSEIAAFFPDSDWERLECREYESGRYGRKKKLWEAGLRRR